MKYFHETLLTIVVFSLKIILINCIKPPRWFMHDKFLYYVDIEQNYTSSFAQKECLKHGMIFQITQANAQELLPHLKEVYGDFPALWTYNNEYYNKILNVHLKLHSCFKLDAAMKIYIGSDCSEKFGLICKVLMKHAVINHQNSVVRVEGTNIKEFCDPNANTINGVINSCLIFL